MAVGGKNVIELIIAARDRTQGAFGKVGAQMRSATGQTGKLNTGMKGLSGSMGKASGMAGKLATAIGPLGIAGAAVAAVAAVGMFAASTVKSFTAFEDSMANVRKTTGMTKEETAALGHAIDDMALRLPVAHGELAKIAAIAGQLGIQGKTNILGFTEDIAKMSTAFDMSAEDTATAMAKLANIYDIPIEKASNLGSAINVLGNTTAASESQLMDFSMSLGPTGQQLGFSATQTLALGASMIEMGVNSSDAGTRLNRAFTMIGQNLDELSTFMGVSTAEFTKSFEDMPMETFMQVLQKLSQVEGKLKANTTASALFNEVGAKAIKGLTGNLDGLQTNLTAAATGFKENTSLTDEFAAKTDTLKAKFAIVGNAAESLKINIGQALAPLAGALAAGAATGISGLSKAFSAMQKIAGPVFHALKASLEGLFGPLITALAPLQGMLGDTSGAVSRLNGVFRLMSDVFTIITGLAKKLGNILGTLLATAITPLVAKIQEGIATLTEFYDKLGPIKGLIEGIKDKVGAGAKAIGEWADSFKEAAPPAEELAGAVSELAEEAVKLEPVLTESLKTLESRLTGASGNYKTAIGDITKEIDVLKDAWNLASDDQKVAIEKQIEALVGVRDELGDGEEEAVKYFDTHKEGTEEATEKQEEFSVKIGETTVTFKGMAAEVVKNADAYADLQKNAETLLNLDWNVFTELEAHLPEIDAGIGNMSTAFVGLKGVLEENIGELEAVKTSVMEISEIAAPFLEEGFLDGIKAIGNFAGSLQDAGAAINTFSSLQDVSIEGCIDFSLHVNDMVSALQILENQMADLVPSFEKMNSLIDDIAVGFLGGIDITAEYGKEWEALQKQFGMVGLDMVESNKLIAEVFELTVDEILLLRKEGDLTTFAFMKQTNAMKLQTTQLSKITDALAPYLNFMRILNELAALSTLSTDELNTGLNAITDTLMHLSKALSTFDLEPVMQSLFGSEAEGEGSAKKFTDTMLAHASDFDTLIAYIERLAIAITTLTSSFAAFEGINKSVLADETALIGLFESITDIMENFSSAMDKSGFGDKLVSGIEKMVASSAPLTTYFANNNAAVTQFNNTLTAFKTTVGNVVDVMDRLLELTAMTVPEVAELAAGFDVAKDFVDTFNDALLLHIGIGEREGSGTRMFDNLFTSIKDFANDWAAITVDMDESFTIFEDAISTITGIISNIASLTKAFSDMKDLVIPDVIEIEAAMNKILEAIKAMTEFLGTETWAAISANIATFALKWEAANEGISTSMDSFSHFVGTITKIVSACTEMARIFTDMGEIIVIKSDEIAEALKDIPEVMTEITKYLTTDSFKAIEKGLIDLDTQYNKHAKILDEIMPSYDSAFNMFNKLADGVISLSDAFDSLKDATIISSIDTDKAMQNIDVFVNRFIEALRINMDNLIASLIDLDAEWAKHAEEMKLVMPSYETATKDIGTLIGSITSLGSALLSLSEMGVISSKKFDAGFVSLIKSVANFSKSLRNNVLPLIASLEMLRKAWIENESVLVPLMRDFITITRSFASLAYNTNSMTEAFSALSKNSGSLEKGFVSLIKFITQVVSNTKEFYTPEAAAQIGQYITDIEQVIYAFRYLAEHLEGATSDIEKEVKDAVSAVSTKVQSLKSIIPDMYTYGANSIIAFAQGIQDYEWELINVISNVANTIKKYLGVSSPTELGALKDIETWPKNLVKSFASGIKNEMGSLNASFSGMALSAPGGGGGGNRTSITFHVTQHITDRASAIVATNDLERMLNRHEVL